MSGKLNKGIVLAALIVYLLVGALPADAAEDRVTIAVLPCYDIVMTFKKFYALIEYLERETGLDIKIIIQTDFAEFEVATRNGDIDFALQDPHTYMRLAELYKQDFLIRSLTPEGGRSRRGAIIVRRDSGLTKIEDLKDKTVMFGPKQSIAKWSAARMLLERENIDLDRDLRAYSNGRCCEDIAFNVYLEAFDAGVVCEHFIDEYKLEKKELGIDIEQIVAIGKTEEMPTRVFATSKNVSDDIASKVIDALLQLDKTNPMHADLMERAELGGFERARNEDYEDLKRTIRIEL
jgi:phosphonate transport system substrate-binding protein